MSSPGALIATFTGPLLVSAILEWSLLGALTVQVLTFFFNPFRGNWFLKLLVCFIYSVSLTSSVTILTWYWEIFAAGRGDPSVFSSVPWQMTAHTIPTGIMASMEHCFLSWRLWNFKSRSTVMRCVLIFVLCISFMQAALGVWLSVVASTNKTIGAIAAFRTIISLMLIGACAADTIVAISMIIALNQAGRDAHSRQSRAVLQKLIIRTIETGSITAMAALIDLTLFYCIPKSYIYVAVGNLICNLYSNVILANLNGRKALALTFQEGHSNTTAITLPPLSSSQSSIPPVRPL